MIQNSSWLGIQRFSITGSEASKASAAFQSPSPILLSVMAEVYMLEAS